jgi:hypothetical protein
MVLPSASSQGSPTLPDAPLWIDEGIASLFEAPVFGDGGEIHGEVWSRRHARLAQAFASPKERDAARLDVLFGMRTLGFKAKSPTTGGVDESLRELHYAMARSVCSWLDAQGKLWPFYQAWRDDWKGDRTGETAFRKVMGATPGELHETWAKWAK